MNAKEAEALAKSMAAECIAVRVRRLSRVVSSIYDREFKELGIKGNQATMLVALSFPDVKSPSAVGRTLKMEKSTVSRNLDRMRVKGWIEIIDSGEGIQHTVRMTQSGLDLLERVHVKWKIAQKKASELLGSDGLASIMLLASKSRK